MILCEYRATRVGDLCHYVHTCTYCISIFLCKASCKYLWIHLKWRTYDVARRVDGEILGITAKPYFLRCMRVVYVQSAYMLSYTRVLYVQGVYMLSYTWDVCVQGVYMLSYMWVVCVQAMYMPSYMRVVCIQGAYMLVNLWKLEEMKMKRF